MIPEGEVGCKICEKSIYRIFVEHIQEHLNGLGKEEDFPKDCGRKVADISHGIQTRYCCERHRKELYKLLEGLCK